VSTGWIENSRTGRYPSPAQIAQKRGMNHGLYLLSETILSFDIRFFVEIEIGETQCKQSYNSYDYHELYKCETFFGHNRLFIENNLQKNTKIDILVDVRCFSGLYPRCSNIQFYLFSFFIMQYTKYAVTVATLTLVSLSAVASAATGSVVSTGTTTVTSTGVTAGASSLEVKGAPRLVKKASDSVALEWDSVPTASAYIVKYSKTSVANSKDTNAQYDNETDQVTTTGAVITKLSSSNEKLAPATAYYFSVVAIDKDGKESDTFSDELMVTTEAAGMTASSGATVAATTTTTAALAIKDLVVSDDKTLTLSFNSSLSADPVRVKITKTSDNSDIAVATVVQEQVNLNTVTVTTLSALSPASSYTLTVLAAKDASGNTVQEGVSGLKEFTTAETLKASAIASENASGATLSGTLSTESATKVATGAKET